MCSMHKYSERQKCLQRMSEASSVVASVTQQFGQRVPQSRTEYRKCPKPRVQMVRTARQADDQRQSVDDISVPSRRLEHYNAVGS